LKQGTLVFKSGDTYVGGFKDDKFDGKGKLTYSPRDPLKRISYEGGFRSGKRHGSGKFVWSNGAVYEGTYIDDERIGFGRLIFDRNDPFQRLEYKGQWERSVMSGHGKLTYKVNPEETA
jgi:hypothetical protein